MKPLHDGSPVVGELGHAGHQEVIGTMGQVKMHLVEKAEDVDKLEISSDSQIAYITQTTLSKYETAEIEDALIKRFPNLTTSKNDICYATTNRQEAVMSLLGRVNLFLVVGEENSSNSKRLVETAKQNGVDAYLISTFRNIEDKWLDNVKSAGITSGASAPEKLVREIVEYLRKNYGGKVEEYIHVTEKVNFPDKILV